MKVLVINQYGKGELFQREFIPRVGDKIDVFYEPLPVVTAVVAWPSAERLKALKMDEHNIEAIITVV